MIYLGIDPGKGGGIAYVDTAPTDDAPERDAFKIPATEKDLWELIASFAGPSTFALIELVHSSPQMGVKSAFTFGQNYGTYRAMLIAAGIPFETITPNKWMTVMRCKSGGDKNVTKRRAQELFPGLKVTHAIADALLIAEYGKRTYAGSGTSATPT